MYVYIHMYTHAYIHKHVHMYIFIIGYLDFLVNKLHLISLSFLMVGSSFSY